MLRTKNKEVRRRSNTHHCFPFFRCSTLKVNTKEKTPIYETKGKETKTNHTKKQCHRKMPTLRLWLSAPRLWHGPCAWKSTHLTQTWHPKDQGSMENTKVTKVKRYVKMTNSMVSWVSLVPYFSNSWSQREAKTLEFLSHRWRVCTTWDVTQHSHWLSSVPFQPWFYITWIRILRATLILTARLEV